MQRSRVRRKPITAAQGRVADLTDAAQFKKLSEKYSDRLIVLVAYTVISPEKSSSCTIFNSGRVSSDAACLSLCLHTETCLCTCRHGTQVARSCESCSSTSQARLSTIMWSFWKLTVRKTACG